MDFVDQQLFAQLVFTTWDSAFMTMGPLLRTKEPSLRISSKGGNPPEQAGQKLLCQYAGQPGEIFKLGTMQMGCKQVRKWWTGMASKGCNVIRRNLTIVKTGLKGGCLNHMHIRE